MVPDQNRSELLLEDYFRHQSMKFDHHKPYPGKSKLVDYTVYWQGKEYLFEVKEFAPTEMPTTIMAFDPYPKIRERIDRARQKFKEYDGFPCSLVLRNEYPTPLIDLESPHAMTGAIYGDVGFTIPVNPDLGGAVGEPTRAFLGGGKMIRPHWKEPENTRISAVITLRNYAIGVKKYLKWMDEVRVNPELPEPDADERVVCVVVWENAFADIPLPEDMFRDDYDERWGHVDGHIRLKYRGRGLPDA
jgi:hypothetical protein